MKGFMVKEVADALGETTGDDALPLVTVIGNLRDEVTVMSVKGHGYGDRNLSMCIARLDEARMWAEEYGKAQGTLLLVDKRRYVENLRVTEPTETTDGEG